MAGAAAGALGLVGHLTGAGRTAIEVMDTPGAVQALDERQDSLAEVLEDLSVQVRLRICEMHRLFPSECPAFASLTGKEAGR